MLFIFHLFLFPSMMTLYNRALLLCPPYLHIFFFLTIITTGWIIYKHFPTVCLPLQTAESLLAWTFLFLIFTFPSIWKMPNTQEWLTNIDSLNKWAINHSFPTFIPHPDNFYFRALWDLGLSTPPFSAPEHPNVIFASSLTSFLLFSEWCLFSLPWFSDTTSFCVLLYWYMVL